MPGSVFVVGQGRHRFVVQVALAVALVGSVLMPVSGRAIQEGGNDEASVRIVHGIADAGPLDVYIDGSLALIGIVLADTSADLFLPGGEHAFAVVPSGELPEAAIAAGTIALQGDSRSYAALLGTLDAASVGLFAVDDRPLDQGQARFRIISGVPDAGEIVPIFAGGDALSQPLGFGDASQYAAIDAGTYDLDLLEAASGVSLLALPQTPFAEGTTTDVMLVGQVSDGSLRALVQSTVVDVARILGRSAQIVAGSCAQRQDAVAELGVVQTGQGAAVGTAGTALVAQGFGLAAVPFASLIASPHSVTVSEDRETGGGVVACGDVGGNLTDTGALVIALEMDGSGAVGGVAVLAPALEDPGASGVSVFLIAEAGSSDGVATPQAATG